LTVVNETVDPTFRFMTVDWDGQIRMDPSSPYAMQRLISLRDRFQIAFGADTDHDRPGCHPQQGLLPQPLPFGGHLLPFPTPHPFGGRRRWGKTVVSVR